MRPRRVMRTWSAVAALVLVGTSIAGAQSPAPTVDPAPAEVGPASLRMRLVPLPGDVPYAPLEGVTAGGPGWVAVGATVAQEVGPVDTLILTSTDGGTWTQVPLGELAQVGSLSDIVAVPTGLVAVGAVRDAEDRQHAIALASTDGLTWQASTDRDLRNAFMSGIAAWGDGVAAVGCRLGPDGLCDRPSVWTSVDGLDWERVAMPRAAGEPNAVASGDGLLVVMGVSSAIADGRPVVTTTRDLSTWTRRELGFEGSLGPAVIEGDQVFAAGTLIDQDGDVLRRGVVVFSPDAGRRWVRMPLTAPNGSAFEGLSMAGPTIAFGSREDARSQVSPAAWFSRLGVDWTRIRGVRSSVIGAVADFAPFAGRPGGIAVGATGDFGGGPAIWRIEVPG